MDTPRHNTKTLIGERVRDLVVGDCGTVVGCSGRKYRVEWDRGTPHPSFIDPSDCFWELLSASPTEGR